MGSGDFSFGTATGKRLGLIRGTFEGTGGTLNMTAAQITASASPVTIYATGTILRYIQVN